MRLFFTLGLSFFLITFSSCSSELEVRGNTNKIVGERVTLSIVSGDLFGSNILLTDAANKKYTDNLNVELSADKKEISFDIPIGITAGKADVTTFDEEGNENYRVPIDISRLAISLSEDGQIESLALPPSTIAPTSQSIGTIGEFIEISATGNLIAVIANSQLRFYGIAAPFNELAPPTSATNTRALAALPNGAVIADDTHLHVFRVTEGSISTGGSAPLPYIKNMDVSLDGETLIVLAECDTTDDSIVDSDCLFSINLSTVQPQVISSITLDDTPSAYALAASYDGKSAIVGDNGNLYGVDFSIPDTPKLVAFNNYPDKIVIPELTPRIIAKTLARIADEIRTLYAVADTDHQKIYRFGFFFDTETQSYKIGQVGNDILQLDTTPDMISFGKGTNLYVVSGSKLMHSDLGMESLTANVIDKEFTKPSIGFVVQP